MSKSSEKTNIYYSGPRLRPSKIEDIDSPYPSPLTKEELARHFKVGLRTVDNWIASGRFPYMKIGRLVRFSLPDVTRALERYTIKGVALS